MILVSVQSRRLSDGTDDTIGHHHDRQPGDKRLRRDDTAAAFQNIQYGDRQDRTEGGRENRGERDSRLQPVDGRL